MDDQTYGVLGNKFNFPHRTPIEHFRQNGTNVLTWNTNVVSTAFGRFSKPPDAFYENNNQVIIAGVVVVADENMNKFYYIKKSDYQEVAEFFSFTMQIKKSLCHSNHHLDKWSDPTGKH